MRTYHLNIKKHFEYFNSMSPQSYKKPESSHFLKTSQNKLLTEFFQKYHSPGGAQLVINLSQLYIESLGVQLLEVLPLKLLEFFHLLTRNILNTEY
jgi:hypothetical protein